MQRVAQASLAHIPGLVLWTTTEVLFHEQGPLANIWLKGIPQRDQVTHPSDSLRHRIFDMAPEKNVTGIVVSIEVD